MFHTNAFTFALTLTASATLMSGLAQAGSRAECRDKLKKEYRSYNMVDESREVHFNDWKRRFDKYHEKLEVTSKTLTTAFRNASVPFTKAEREKLAGLERCNLLVTASNPSPDCMRSPDSVSSMRLIRDKLKSIRSLTNYTQCTNQDTPDGKMDWEATYPYYQALNHMPYGNSPEEMEILMGTRIAGIEPGQVGIHECQFNWKSYLPYKFSKVVYSPFSYGKPFSIHGCAVDQLNGSEIPLCGEMSITQLIKGEGNFTPDGILSSRPISEAEFVAKNEERCSGFSVNELLPTHIHGDRRVVERERKTLIQEPQDSLNERTSSPDSQAAR
jgi:hypothetical protein